MDIKINSQMLLDKLRDLSDWPDIKDKVEALKGKKFGFDLVVAMISLISDVMMVVEGIVEKVGAVKIGAEKRKAVVEFVDKSIELPFYLEGIDGPLIGMIVDRLCDLLNFGRK